MSLQIDATGFAKRKTPLPFALGWAIIPLLHPAKRFFE